MNIIGCDFHSRMQVIAMLETETGEVIQRRLDHESGEAKAFYEGLKGPVLVGIESTGYTRWFAEMLAGLGYELVAGGAHMGGADIDFRCLRSAELSGLDRRGAAASSMMAAAGRVWDNGFYYVMPLTGSISGGHHEPEIAHCLNHRWDRDCCAGRLAVCDSGQSVPAHY